MLEGDNWKTVGGENTQDKNQSLIDKKESLHYKFESFNFITACSFQDSKLFDLK